MVTTWDKMISGKELAPIKSSRRKVVLTRKINVSDLPKYVDQGWEKYKDYKNVKFVGIDKEKSSDEQFADKLWLLFESMGFLELNSDRHFQMKYDFRDNDKSERIDVIAVDDETLIIVKCFTSENIIESNFAEEILLFSSKITGLRKEALKRYPKRKIKFIWATHNYILSRRDHELFEKEGITLFNESTVDYYVELSKHLGSSSRYQLLGNLFASQEIKNMDDRVPAIQGKMGGNTYYSFSIEPEKLLKVGYVLHRSETNHNMMPTYQRIIKRKRLQDVQSFINSGGYFPNSIIISIDTKGKGVVFEQSTNKVEGMISKIGILRIPKRYRSAYIIDGQHRLYGYSDSKYSETNSIPVVAFVDLDRNEQIKLFMDINENQKAVPKSLRVTLNADMLWDSKDFSEQRQALRSKIAQMLGEVSTSPLHSRIVIGETDSTPDRCITVEAIQSALKKTRFFNEYGKNNIVQKEGAFDWDSNQETCDLFYPFIERIFLYFKNTCHDEWSKGDRDSGILTINRGIQAIIRITDDIVYMLVDKGMIFPKNQEIEDMFDLIKYYFKPLADYINNLTGSQRKDLRGYFGGGADTRFWRAFQKSISDVRPDFSPLGLIEYWQNESREFNDETKSMIHEIESKIKLIISERLIDYFGESWLIKGIPKNIYTRAKVAADEAQYDNIASDGEELDKPIWDFVTLGECKPIILHGKNWFLFFEDTFVRPEEVNISGGKDPKTDWIFRLNTILNKLSRESYSVPLDEYTYVKSIHEWISEILIL